nr:unnamed protein product [Callosobruchus chinensis]
MSNRPISVVELERRTLAMAASLSKDLEAITAWGLNNIVEFNASKIRTKEGLPRFNNNTNSNKETCRKNDRGTADLKDKQKKFTADEGRLKQLLDNQIPRSTDIKNKFDRDTKNLWKKSEQYETALGKLNKKHDREVAALNNEIKKLEDLDQLKKARKCAKQMIAQLEAEIASKNKNDNTTAEAEKARIKEEKSTLREKLAQLEAENKKLKSDLSKTLDDAKKNMADLTRAKDVDNKMKQRLANLENENN